MTPSPFPARRPRPTALLCTAVAALVVGCGLVGWGLVGWGLAAPLRADETTMLRFSENEVAHGDLLQGEVVEKSVTIHNDGDALLKISDAKPSCGCTEVLEYPQVVEPGKSGIVRYTIDSKRIKPGDNRKRIRFTTNDPTQHSADYYFSSDVVKLYRSDPQAIRVSGLYDREKSTKVRLIGITDYGFELLGVRSREGKFDPEVVMVEEGVYEVTIHVPPVAAPARDRDPLDLLIQVKDGRQITVGQWVDIDHWNPISVSAVGQVQFSNRDTDRLIADPATPVAKMVTLLSRDPERPFAVEGVRLEGFPEGVFSTQLTEVKPGLHFEVLLILHSYSDEAYLRGKVHIDTDASIEPTRTLNLLARFGKR